MEKFKRTYDPENLKPQELKAVYAISRVIARETDRDKALDQIIHHVRSVFIFDNFVLYQPQDNSFLEPTYARAIGRGRSAEADSAWGDQVAIDVFKDGGSIFHREKLGDNAENRFNLRFSLGLPLRMGDKLLGALVFIRFGGPPFTPDQIHLAEFIAHHAAQLLERQQFINRIANLEAERRLNQLQEDFIATVTHDLKTPLGFIKGYATSLLREDTDWDKATYREFLLIIDEETDRLNNLIENILDTSRLQAGTLKMTYQKVQLDALLKSIVQRSKLLDSTLNLKLLPNDLPGLIIVKGDPTRLAQVFDNIINNASKYAPGSSVKILLSADNDFAHIEVHDDGPGIPEEYLEDIFKRFFRVPNVISSIRGSGLGLFICRQVIETHKGKIYAESCEEKGATFHISLPLFISDGR